MTSPLPNNDIIVKRKKMRPKMSTTRGCWGGNFPQCSWTTSLIWSGKPSRWVEPVSKCSWLAIHYPVRHTDREEYHSPVQYVYFDTFGAEIGRLCPPKSVFKGPWEIEYWAILLQNRLNYHSLRVCIKKTIFRERERWAAICKSSED